MTAVACIDRSDAGLPALLVAFDRAELRHARLSSLRDRALMIATRRAEACAMVDTDPLISALLADRAAPRASANPPGFSDFRRAMSILHREGQVSRPVTGRRIAGNLSRRDADRIEALEAAAARALDRLAAIEAAVLETPPASTVEAVAKLRFLSALLLTGGSLEIDYFAWLVDECAQAIQASDGARLQSSASDANRKI
jgi:hypothetical protein